MKEVRKSKKKVACKYVTLWNTLILPTGAHGLIDIMQCLFPLGLAWKKGENSLSFSHCFKETHLYPAFH